MQSYGLFWKLLVSSNQQMRETLLNSIMNQIRYPNPITFYFTNLIFYIFSVPASDDNLLEQIIRYFFFLDKKCANIQIIGSLLIDWLWIDHTHGA